MPATQASHVDGETELSLPLRRRSPRGKLSIRTPRRLAVGCDQAKAQNATLSAEPAPNENEQRTEEEQLGSPPSMESEQSFSTMPSDVSNSTSKSNVIDLRQLRGVKDAKLLWHMEVLYSENDEASEQASTMTPLSSVDAGDASEGASTQAPDADDILDAHEGHEIEKPAASTASDRSVLTRTRPRRRQRIAGSTRNANTSEGEEGFASPSSSLRMSARLRRRHNRFAMSPSPSEAQDTDEESGMSPRRSSRPKACTKCFSAFIGYGPTCGACRQLGKQDSIKQCQQCQVETPAPAASQGVIAATLCINTFGGLSPLEGVQASEDIQFEPVSMNEEEQAESLICLLYAKRNPAKLREVDALLKQYKGSSKVDFYKRVCEKYGETPFMFRSELREQRAYELIRDLYMRRSPAKIAEVENVLKQHKGSRVNFYKRICEKYGERPQHLDAEPASQAVPEAAMPPPPPPLTPTRTDIVKEEAAGWFDQGCITLTRQGSRKQCGRCQAMFCGFGTVCSDCRKGGMQGGVRQCSGCSTYFHGFGDTCCDCAGLA